MKKFYTFLLKKTQQSGKKLHNFRCEGIRVTGYELRVEREKQ